MVIKRDVVNAIPIPQESDKLASKQFYRLPTVRCYEFNVQQVIELHKHKISEPVLPRNIAM